MAEESDHDKVIRLEERFDSAQRALRLSYIQSIVAAVLAALALFKK